MNAPTGQLVLTSALGTLVLGAILFLPAGSFDYWQAWLFLATFMVVSQALGLYLFINDPVLLERRMKVGPQAEQEKNQSAAMWLGLVAVLVLLVLPGFDRRFGWSSMPAWLSVFGDALVAVSFIMFFFVLRENSFGASTVRIMEGQTVISTGPYAVVRHPMYSGVLVLLVGMALALGSWWGLIGVVLGAAALAYRLTAEESFLVSRLAGYADYVQRVRWRLVPGVY